jgi:hypothetical protein
VRALDPGETIWDTAVTGFAARRQQSDAVTYVVYYRTSEGRQRWFRIGRHGSPWTPEEARTKALRVLGGVARGSDPAGDRRSRRGATGVTVSDLCNQYLADVEAGRLLTRRRTAKRPSTIATDRSRIEAHIRPLLGHLPLAAVTQDDIERLLHDIIAGTTRRRAKLNRPHALSNVWGGRGAASRSWGLLGAVLAYAVRRGLRADNPAIGVV